jgi:ABC-type sugar transport system ATPase subunit
VSGIRLENVAKAFGKGLPILSGLNLEVGEKEFMTLVGPSGAGKTTLLRIIAGLESCDGKVFIADREVTSAPPEKRDVAIVFQTHALYPHLTVEENLSFPLRLRHVAKAEISERVQKIASLLQVNSLLRRKPSELSGGESQRVALGRALIREPAALLMDEPLSSLPPDLRFHLRGELLRIHRERARPTLYVTHDHEEALALGERVAVLFEGRIQQVGTPWEIYERPANRFVAGFVGRPSMNFIGGGVVRGVRPEHFAICGETDAWIKGRIESAQYLGAFTDVQVSFEGGELIVRTAEKREFRVGDKLYLRAREENIHRFDPKTGARV